MSCDSYRESLLDFDWDEATRQRAAALLDHLKGCPDCQAAVRDFDRLRSLLKTPDLEAEPIGGWAQFTQRFEQRFTAAAPRPPRWRPLFIALAASALIAGIGFYAAQKALPPSSPAALNVLEAAVPARPALEFQPEKISHDVRVFHQVAGCFEGRASWVLMSDDGAADMGTTSGEALDSDKVLLLRLEILNGGKLASDADLLVVPGRTADVTIPLKGGQSLHYKIGTSAKEPRHISLWLQVQAPHGGQPIAALSTHLQLQPGQQMIAGQVATPAGPLELKVAFAQEDLPTDKS